MQPVGKGKQLEQSGCSNCGTRVTGVNGEAGAIVADTWHA